MTALQFHNMLASEEGRKLKRVVIMGTVVAVSATPNTVYRNDKSSVAFTATQAAHRRPGIGSIALVVIACTSRFAVTSFELVDVARSEMEPS